jgi:AbrB family looped-hinge helix DNA binding protein
MGDSMTEKFETTTLSTKGQIVIPEDIRESMHLKPGTKFVVIGMNDTLMLKRIEKPRFERFDEMAAKAREKTIIKKLSGLSEDERTREIQKLVDKYREEKRKRQ